MTHVTGVVGSGTMGQGIAQLAALAGEQVLLYDILPSQSQEAKRLIHRYLDKMVQKSQLQTSAAVAAKERIQTIASLDEMHQADLIIEAIVEKLEAKQSLFRTLESIVNPQTVLATNTSSLSVTAIAASCQHSDRVLGTHFFNPAPLMPLVEVIPALQTDPDIIEAMDRRLKSWDKTVVLVKDTPGFIVNRVARPYYSEALRLLEEGIATETEIDLAMTREAGFPMGPFTLMDYIGNDVNLAVTTSMFAAYSGEARYRPSIIQQRLVEAGFLGRKSGRGFYRYPIPTSDFDHLEPEVAKRVVDRILTMLINEAADAWYFGIASATDIDRAMQLGARYPRGLLEWAEEIGIITCIQRLESWYRYYGDPRYRVSPGLRYVLERNATFYTETCR